MNERWTELPVVVAARWALAQALRQWKTYADDIRALDHHHNLGSGDELEDKIYGRASAALEGLEAAADDSEKAANGHETRVDRLLARWREDANAMMVIADHSDSPEREECIERAKVLNDCADAIEREMAGANVEKP